MSKMEQKTRSGEQSKDGDGRPELVVAPKLIDPRFADQDRCSRRTEPITKPKMNIEAELNALLSDPEKRAEAVATLKRVAQVHGLRVIDLEGKDYARDLGEVCDDSLLRTL